MLNADLTLATEDITEDDMKMVAAKQVAFMGGRKRFKEMKEFSKLRRSKYYHD